MATAVEQRELMFWLNFSAKAAWKVYEKSNRNSTRKVRFFFLHMCKFTFRLVFHSSALEARNGF